MVEQSSDDPSLTAHPLKPATNGRQSYKSAPGSTVRKVSRDGAEVHNSKTFRSFDESHSILRSDSGTNNVVLNRLLRLASAAETTATMYHAIRSASMAALDSSTKSTRLSLENGPVMGNRAKSMRFAQPVSKIDRYRDDGKLEKPGKQNKQKPERKNYTHIIKLTKEEHDQLLLANKALNEKKLVLEGLHHDFDHDAVEIRKERDRLKLKVEQLESTMSDILTMQETTKEHDYRADYERLCVENHHLNASIAALIAAQVDADLDTAKVTIRKQLFNRIPTFTSVFPCSIKPSTGSYGVSRNVDETSLHNGRPKSRLVAPVEPQVTAESLNSSDTGTLSNTTYPPH